MNKFRTRNDPSLHETSRPRAGGLTRQEVIDAHLSIDSPDDVTPARLRQYAKSAVSTGKLHFAEAFDHAAARIEQLEKQVRKP